jgi:hypothetical protein
MTTEQFCYWLQGFVELRGSTPTPGEWDVIKDHLATVFKKVTPNYPTPGIATPTLPGPTPFVWPTYGKPEVTCSVSAPGGMEFRSIKLGEVK